MPQASPPPTGCHRFVDPLYDPEDQEDWIEFRPGDWTWRRER